MVRPEWILLFVLAWLSAGARAELPPEIKRALASRDYGSAVVWLEAHPGDPEAEYELGRLYRLGKGVPEDEARALKCFERAAEAGFVEAQYLLGKHYEKVGELAAATEWMSKAADAGHRRAASWEAPGQVQSSMSVAKMIRGNRTPPASGFSAVEVNATDAAGRTALMLAAGAGSTQWLKMLLASGANIQDVDPHGTTALHMAVVAGEFVAVKVLLGAGANPDAVNGEGNTALHLAVASDSLENVEALLAARASRDLENAAGWSASALVLRAGKKQMMELFGLRDIVKPSAVLMVDAERLSQLVTDAALRGDLNRLGELLAHEQFDPEDQLLAHLPRTLAEEGDAEALDHLLSAGLSTSASDNRGRTALLVAGEKNCLACLETLINYGAQMEATDAQGRTALLLAAREGHESVVALLLDRGADRTAADSLERNALWWAVSERHEAVAITLLRADVPVRADSERLSPLHLAASLGSSSLIILLANRIPVDGQAGDGNTALLIAAHSGSLGALRALIGLNADVNYRNGLGDTALIMAARESHLDAARILLDAGANPDVRNDRFESAGSIAESRGDAEWLELLESAESSVLDLLGAR